MASKFARIQHIVIVMLENRSFDNLLGFLYADWNNRPLLNLPAQAEPTYEGLLPRDVTDRFWCPSNPGFFSGSAPEKVFAEAPTTGFHVPNPDPNELFQNFAYQLFGTSDVVAGTIPGMQGFLVDYQTA